MTRITAVLCLLSGLATAGQDPPPPEHPHKDDATVRVIALGDIRSFSREAGKAVIGSLPDENGHGHVVIAAPGKDRVYDGNTIGGFKDLMANAEVSNSSVLNRMNLFIKEKFPNDKADIKNASKEQVQKYLDTYIEVGAPASHSWARTPAYDKNTLEAFKARLANPDVAIPDSKTVERMSAFIKKNFPQESADIAKASPEQIQKYLDRYGRKLEETGGKSDLDRVKWYQVPTDKNVKEVVAAYQPPKAATPEAQNLRCNDLLQQAVPIVKSMVKEEVAPGQGQGTPYVNANNIDRALGTRSKETEVAEAPPVEKPATPPAPPVFEDKSRETKVETKPGGVIITACAEIEGLKAEDVSSAAFDSSKGVLTLALSSGATVTCALDPDEFTIAVRCVFEREVDPSLSMSWSDKPGYHAVNYCGPLFKSRFGKILYNTDNLLGAIIFNQDGPHRSIAAEIIPHYVAMTWEAHRTMSVGSRVFLRAHGARFAVQDGRLECRRILTKVDVEGMDSAADYFQDSLHKLARAMDDHFEALTENFEEFRDFTRVAQGVAIAKWLKRHSIPFDWAPLKTRAVGEVDIPAYSPTDDWTFIFNGRTMDGWRSNLPSRELEWKSDEGCVTVRPTGEKALEFLYPNWSADFDLRYTVITEGPVELILRSGEGEGGASATIDSHGRPQKFELFFRKGEWTVTGPAFGKTGKVVVPERKKDQPAPRGDFGFRVPAGSKLTLFDALERSR